MASFQLNFIESLSFGRRDNNIKDEQQLIVIETNLIAENKSTVRIIKILF